ncbi:MAG: metallophosphoesterase, partial [Frankiales bacterium]|nr:metallophosphoesterase [Frankiales bacterium]
MLRAVLALLVGVLVLGLYLGWLHQRLVVAPELPRPWRRVVDAVLALGVVAFVAAAALLRQGDPATTRPVVWVGMTTLAVALYLTIGLVLLGLVALGLRLAGRTAARTRVLRTGTAAVVVLALAVTAYG